MGSQQYKGDGNSSDDNQSVNSSISNSSRTIHKEKRQSCKTRKKGSEMNSHNPRQGYEQL